MEARWGCEWGGCGGGRVGESGGLVMCLFDRCQKRYYREMGKIGRTREEEGGGGGGGEGGGRNGE